jgi:hypothetical protein
LIFIIDVMTVKAPLWQLCVVEQQCKTEAACPDRHDINREIQTPLIS